MGQAGTLGELTGDIWRQRGDKERPHKTRDFEKCASMPKTSLLGYIEAAEPEYALSFFQIGSSF